MSSRVVHRLRQRARVSYRYLPIEATLVIAQREPLEDLELRALRRPTLIEIRIVDVRRFDDERITLPTPNRIAHG